jgi:hypothetical protein
MDEGAKFTCANCSAVLIVGDVQVTKKSLSETGPQFDRKSKEGAPAAASRPRRSRATSETPAPKGKSNVMMFAAIGVVVVIVAIVVAMNAGGPGGSDGGGSGGSGASASEKWWQATEAQLGTMGADQIRASIAEGKQKGYDSNAAFWDSKVGVLYKALLAKAPADDEANRYFGRVALQSFSGFSDLWAAMEKHQANLPDEFLRFYETHLAKVDGKQRVWMTADKFERAQSVLEAFAAWKKKAEADPTPQLVSKGLMRAQALTNGFGALPASELPFIVFLGSKELHKSAEKTVRDAKTADFAPRVDRIKKRVRAIKKAWGEQVAKPLGLPALSNEQPFFVYCFDDKTTFTTVAAAGRGMGLDVGSRLLFFYRPTDPMAFGNIPATPEEDKWFTSDLGHILVHMMQKAYSKDPKDKWGQPFKEWNGLWLMEGLAEYVGAGCRDDGSFSGVSAKASEFLKGADDAGILLFEIRDIVRFSSYQSYLRHMRDSYWPEFHAEKDPPESVGAFIQSVGGRGFFTRPAFQSQCWYLAYFLNHYENGKYKQKFQALVKTMFQGRRKADGTGRYKSSEDAFTQIMGLKSQADWDALQQAYDDYIPKAVGSEE